MVVTAFKWLAACVGGGEADPLCLDFHHTDAADKEATVSELVNGQNSLPVIVAEMQKCIVLCANCHRKLHAVERAA